MSNELERVQAAAGASDAKSYLLTNLERARAAKAAKLEAARKAKAAKRGRVSPVGNASAEQLSRAEARKQEIEARKRLRAVSNPTDSNAYHDAVTAFRDAVRATVIAEDEEA